jgi:hypothetical protein
MSYAQGSVIDASDYNGLVGSNSTTAGTINYVWDTGNGQFGYGQGAVSVVSVAAIITATQWSTMLAALNKALQHQAGAAATLGPVNYTAGSTITYFANVATSVTTINTNKLNFNSTRGATTTGSNLDKVYNTEGATMTHTITVTFASADQARYFFNAGGRLSLVASQGGDFTANDKEIRWAALINAIGTIHLDQLTSTRTGTGETLTTNGSAIGYWDLTTSNQTLIRLTEDTAPYTANYIDIFARVAGAAGSNGGLGTQVIFQIDYVDGSADGGFNDGISGTVRNRIDIVKPEVTYLTDVWGSITVGAA